MLIFIIKYLFASSIVAVVFLTGCIEETKQVFVTGHRGASGLAPENTISSMLKAIEAGADFSELDVQETSDGVLILLHDPSLKRTTGLEKNIWEIDYAALKGIDAGAWFAPEFKGEPIPTLSAVIDTVRGKMKLNIELKMNGHEKHLVEKVAGLITQKNFISQCIVTSFDFAAIDRIKEINKNIRAGYIFNKMPEEVDIFAAGVDLLSVKYTLVDRDFVEKAHANNKEVHVYTVDDPQDMQRMIAFGVDNIITDRPDILFEILHTR